MSVLSLFLFQAPVDATGADMHWIAIELGVIALFFLLLMIGVLIGLVYLMKVVKQVEAKGKQLEARGEALIAQISGKVTPIIDRTNEVVADLTPKIKTVSENVEQMSFTLRSKVDEISDTVTQLNKTVQEFNETAKDANLRTRGQIARVDGMVSDALTTTHEVSLSIQEGIRKPVRKAAEMVQGLKTAVEGFAGRMGEMAGKIPFMQKGPKGPRSPYDF